MMESCEYLTNSPPAEKKFKENQCDDTPKIPTALETNPGFTAPTPFSKNQLKKQRKLAQFEQYRKDKRKKEKERQKQKRREALEKGLPTRTGPSRKELKKKLAAVNNRESLRIVIDLDCDDLMSDRDVAKCVKQCLRIYTINRRLENPVQIHFTGIKTDGNIHKVLQKNDGWENWHVKYHFDEDHLQAFTSPSDLIYLTSESDTILDKLDPKNIYCIGGLVDHNHHKNYCHDRATKAGLRTARLPLGEYVDMKTRSVLSTYHVFEILARVAEGKSWSDAILQTIPPRKGAKPKESINKNITEEEIKNSTTLEKDVLEEDQIKNDEISIVKVNSQKESLVSLSKTKEITQNLENVIGER